MTLSRQFWKIIRAVSGWLRIMASADLIRRPERFATYSEVDGLPSNFLNPYGVEGSWRSKNGEMFFGSTKGLTTFYPDRFSPNAYVPPVVLTDFQLFNKPVQPGADSPLRQADLGDRFPDTDSRRRAFSPWNSLA